MDISSVSNNSGTSYSPMNDNIIKALEKQKEQLQSQIQKIREGKMDAKQKQEKIKEITEQISLLDSQIRQEQMKKVQPDYNKDNSLNKQSNVEDNETQNGYSGGGISSQYMVSAVSDYNSMKTMGKVRTKLKGELRIATGSGENSAAGAGLRSKIQNIEGEMYKKSAEINSKLKKAASEGSNTKINSENTAKENNKSDKKIDSATEQNAPSIDNSEAASSEVQDNNNATLEDKGNKKGANTTTGKVIDVRI